MTAVVAVFDAQLLVDASAYASATWLDWPRIPPITSSPEADCVGAIASSPPFGRDVSLLVSDDLLLQVVMALREDVGLSARDVKAFVDAIVVLARASGGGRVVDTGDRAPAHPDRITVPLALAGRHRAVVVAAARDLWDLGPRWGADEIPIVSPDWFRRRVDARRRARRGQSR